MSNIYDTAPAHSVVSVTKSDSTVLASGCRALYVGTTGDLVVKCWDNSQATFKNVPAGSTLVVKAKQVLNATTAADIVALY